MTQAFLGEHHITIKKQNIKRNMKKVLAIAYWLFAINCFSQTTSFINYGMDQGLVQNQVRSITQDNEGNLFVGTIAGLSKYNGTEWTSYTKSTNLAEDWVTCSYKDKDGNIWF